MEQENLDIEALNIFVALNKMTAPQQSSSSQLAQQLNSFSTYLNLRVCFIVLTSCSPAR